MPKGRGSWGCGKVTSYRRGERGPETAPVFFSTGVARGRCTAYLERAMWDILITAGNLIIIPALLNTVLDKRTYIPRLTSGVSCVGLTAVTVGLVGEGLVFSPIVLALIGLLWVYIFLFRHRPATTPVVESGKR
jgi:hypothetical protein